MIPKQGRVQMCKECGKAHAPHCDQCGSTRDLRSYHGPCGKCAFSKVSSLMPSFLDEMEKISVSMQGMGNWAKAVPGRLGNFVAGGAENVGRTVGAFATPVKSLKRGWHETWNPPGGTMFGKWDRPIQAGLLGMQVIGDAKMVAHPVDQSGQGRSRLHRLSTAIGNTAGGFIGLPHGMAGSMAGGLIGGTIGDRVGKGIDRLRGYRPRPADPHPGLPPRPMGQG